MTISSKQSMPVSDKAAPFVATARGITFCAANGRKRSSSRSCSSLSITKEIKSRWT
jgi:hypothetical protein